MTEKILTPLELKVMNILWKLQKAHVKDILECWAETDNKPAYNTISTTIRILEEKQFVQHIAIGRTHQYVPFISQANYQRNLIGNVLQNAFQGSVSSLISALVSEGSNATSLSAQDHTELQELIKQYSASKK